MRVAAPEKPWLRTVQELLGHKNVSTTMIYTHVLNRGPSGIRSPLDRLVGGVVARASSAPGRRYAAAIR